MVARRILILEILFLIQSSFCSAKSLQKKFDVKNNNVIINELESFNQCDSILKKHSDSPNSILGEAIFHYLNSGSLNDLNKIFDTLVSLKCYPTSTLMNLRNEIISIRKYLKIGKNAAPSLLLRNSLNKKKKMDSETNDYYLELLGIAELLVDQIDSEHPDSIELLEYMLEHVIELENEGYLTTPEANKIIEIVYEKLGSLRD